jgi:hypothetical protein
MGIPFNDQAIRVFGTCIPPHEVRMAGRDSYRPYCLDLIVARLVDTATNGRVSLRLCKFVGETFKNAATLNLRSCELAAQLRYPPVATSISLFEPSAWVAPVD